MIDDFFSNIGEEGEVTRVQRARKHEIVPHQEPELITEVVKIITFILSTYDRLLTPHEALIFTEAELVIGTSPDADAVHVGVTSTLKETPNLLWSHARAEAVGRDPIGAIDKCWHTINPALMRQTSGTQIHDIVKSRREFK